MTSPSKLAEGVRVPIEQAIARGETDLMIAERQSVPLRNVRAVRAALDRLNAQPDVEHQTQEPSRPWGKSKLRPCGTDAGYSRHLRRKEPICDDCRDAHNVANRAAKRRRRRGAA